MKTSPDRKKEIEIDGILVVVRWSKKNQVKTTAVYLAGEKEFIIDSKNKAGKKLREFLGKRIKIVGKISSEKVTPKVIIVTSYEILDW